MVILKQRFAIRRRAPRGACELKSDVLVYLLPPDVRRAPRGACELKYAFPFLPAGAKRRAPRGACELKFLQSQQIVGFFASRPARGV